MWPESKLKKMSLDEMSKAIGKVIGELGNGTCELSIQKATFDEKYGALLESVALETELHLNPKSGITRAGEPRVEPSLSSISVKELEHAIGGSFTEVIGEPYYTSISEIEISQRSKGKMKLKVSRVFEPDFLKGSK